MKQNTMLARLMAKIGASEPVVSASVEALQVEFDAFKASSETALADAAAQLQEVSTALETAVAAVAEADAKAAGLQAQLEAVNAEKIAAEAEAAAKRLTARKEKIEAAVGTSKSDALMAATESLDDAAFDAVVSALSLSVDAEGKTGMFKEVGVAAEADAAKVEESAEMKILREKYSAK
jgi:DNA repair exonuclease SbcCD ATPase subunit